MTASDNEEIFVQDESSLHHYRTEIPNIVLDLGLSPAEFTVYSHIKRIAGDRGACYARRATLLEKIGIGLTQFKKIKKSLSIRREELGGKSLIRVVARKRDDGGRASDLLFINDIWPENIMNYADRPPVAKRPGGGRQTTGIKKNHIKKILKKR